MFPAVLRAMLHSAVSIGVLFFLTRMMGKKQIAQLTLFKQNVRDCEKVLLAYVDSAGGVVTHLRHAPPSSPPVT